MAKAQSHVGPDGKEYPSIREACRAFNKTEHPVYKRMRRGMTLAQAILDAPDADAGSVRYGSRDYPSLAALCSAHGLNYTTVYARIRSGRTLEGAIAEGTSEKNRIRDPFGTGYRSERAMAENWHASRDVLSYRLRNGAGVTAALSMAVGAKWPGTAAGPYTVMRQVEWPWFLCAGPDGDVVLRADRIRDMLEYGGMPPTVAQAARLSRSFKTQAGAGKFNAFVDAMARRHDERLKGEDGNAEKT